MSLINNIQTKARVIFSLPKSLCFNLRCLPFNQAVKLPIILDRSLKLDGVFKKGCIRIVGPVSRGMIRIGTYQGSFDMGLNTESLRMKENSIIEFHGSCNFSRGCNIVLGKDAKIIFGKKCNFNVNTLINAGSEITFGDDFLGGWNVTILDGDGHVITDFEDKALNGYKPISFGRHCWLSAHTSILKGVHLADDIIVPYGNVITKSCDESNCIFGGSPNRVLKNQIKWG